MNPSTFSITVNSPLPSKALLPLADSYHREATLDPRQIMRDELTSLCFLALTVRAWWKAYEGEIRAANLRASADIHDTMSDLAIFARSIARAASLEIDERTIRNYGWGRTSQVLTLKLERSNTGESRIKKPTREL